MKRVKNYNRLCVPAAAVALVLGSTACGGKNNDKKPVVPQPEEQPLACRSAWAPAASYPADPNATDNRKSWTQAAILTLRAQPNLLDSTVVLAGFRHPGEAEWKTSNRIPADVVRAANKFIFKIGNRAIELSLQFGDTVAGSPACTAVPDVTAGLPGSWDTFRESVPDAFEPAWP